MSLSRLFRLGLRQFAAGMLSVLALGILNRVMKVEMGLDLGLVSLIIGIHYFAAPLAIPLGHRSDLKPYFGYSRTPYILIGAGLTALATIAAPFAALHLEETGGTASAALLATGVFLLLGTGIYTAGTAYLSLIADLSPEGERGKAVAVVWSMMMAGILMGVFLGVGILDHYSPERLVTLFTIMGILVAALTVASLWGMERKETQTRASIGLSERKPWSLMIASPQTKLFFGFLFLGILFLFLQNTVLEPFGGDVFGMSVGETTRFNAFQMVGVLLGMAVSGRWLSRRWGNKSTAGVGLIVASVAFLGLVVASLTARIQIVKPAIFTMGLGMGLFNVGGLALMMGMSVEGHVGVYMGSWTLSQALANGLASVGGGYLHDMALASSQSEPIAYAVVFAIEAVGLLGAFALLQRISVVRFREETILSPTMWAETG
ncbi:MAG: MFS transporter [Anaerolineales bacterium]|nr:MFS transporter [Anaerolineales bacterium]